MDGRDSTVGKGTGMDKGYEIDKPRESRESRAERFGIRHLLRCDDGKMHLVKDEVVTDEIVERLPAHMDSGQNTLERKGSGIGLIVGGICVFIVCSIIQAFGDSHMFSLIYYETGNLPLDLLISISMVPGWIITVTLVVKGGRKPMMGKRWGG